MRVSRSVRGRFAALLLLGLAGGILPGCGGDPPREATRLEAEVIAAADVNEDADGRALPIVVRLYELKTPGGFQGADFYGLYDRENEVLGANLLNREELNLRPGQRHRIAREPAPEARYLGVLGAFRKIDDAQWKAVYPLTADVLNRVEIQLGSNAVSIR
ncbi:MAG: type VI secretion system lipoprotein TssJ [Candidatus Thiosymbion ectosymbiont of Robbea hypermnestra]|nr:type VI secretion system lipoprotein TssJ [Candidatus Thiosymbion ectosymbiont of Robbea hypermnestra]